MDILIFLIFFGLGQVSKFSFLVLGQVATIHGNMSPKSLLSIWKVLMKFVGKEVLNSLV
jgi:hypothetical protein